MNARTIKIATIAIASLGWIASAAAQGPGEHMRRPGPGGPGGPGFGPGGPGGPGGPQMEMMAEHLGLSDEQKAQIKAIHEKTRETVEPLAKAAGDAHQAFDQALNAENADAATVGQAALAMRNADRRIEAQHKAAMESVKALLTPEQAAKFEEMQQHIRRPGPEGFGPGGPKGAQRQRRPGGPGGRR